MLLITEYRDYQEMETICEQKDENSKKTYRIKGPFLQAEVKNRNGRIYEQSLLEREIKIFNENKIKQKQAWGELDHPTNPSINLDRVSHMIESLNMEGNNGIGVAKILPTPMGKIVETLLESGGKLGVSTRGVGSLKGNKVNEDYRLITVDVVADPSAPNAFVEGILEGKEYIMQDNVIVEKAIENLEEDLAKHGSRELLNDLQKFISKIDFN